MSTYIVVNHLQPKEGLRDQLIELLREFAVSMHAEPGGIHYSVHQPIDDPSGPLAVVQAYSSVEAFEEHGAWMRSNVPSLAALLVSRPQPPVLHQQVSLSGHARESFSA